MRDCHGISALRDPQFERCQKLAEQIIASGGFIFAFEGQSIFESFNRLFDAALQDIEEQEIDRYGAPLFQLTPEDRISRTKGLSECAFAHFNKQAPEKFTTALIELMSEAMAFAGAICIERSGESDEDINDARPTQTDLQQNVLWWSLQRQRRLPTQQKKDKSDWIEQDASAPPILRAVYEILNNLVLWGYDHNEVQKLLCEHIRPFVEAYDDPERAANDLSIETAELIWENIDGAAQMMVQILITFSEMLVFQSLAQQYCSTYPEEQIKMPKPISASRLKEIADPLFDIWFQTLPVTLSKRGRPTKEVDTEKVAQERAEFIEAVQAAIEKLRIPDKGNIGLELGFGKSREGLSPTKEAAAKTLRETARRLQVDLDQLIKEKKAELENSEK